MRKIAIYLPQFHPIEENNKWWGEGFTEWTNVVKSKPRFKNHYQPQLPSSLGFYDLRLKESRLLQEKLAKDYNIHGFCYYHYWFNGKRLLNEPIDRKFENKEEKLPFMFCWANENWTRAWNGSEKNILIKQNYSEEDDRNHIKFLLKYFKDERYIKVNGKPVFIVYKPDLFPNIKKTIEIFRNEAKKEGVELYICWFERSIGWNQSDSKGAGFDASIDFQPLSSSYKKFIKRREEKFSKKTFLLKKGLSLIKRIKAIGNKNIKLNNLVNYKDFVEFDLAQKDEGKKYPGICPGWDNSSRRTNQNATIFYNNTPELFKKWYEGKCNDFVPFSDEEDFIFINAWNEWAEGNHLEPCEKWEKSFLEVIK
ncbi:MAG: glycosyl hydrolase [Flavobacteriaceae bacterium]|nr:MAG: glycosyl hydrolase [Flavobacteriaceae bacterium]